VFPDSSVTVKLCRGRLALEKIEGVPDLLSQGTKQWNDRLDAARDRQFDGDVDDPEIRIEKVTLEGLDLEGFNFSSITFCQCAIKNCTFSACDWGGTEFIDCKLELAIFVDGNGENLKIRSSKLQDSKFQSLRMGEGEFSESNFDKVDFEDCSWDGDEFSKCVFMRSVIVDCVFEECNFESCRFHFSHLWHSRFRFCSFDDISISGFDFMNIAGNSSLRFPKWHDLSETTEEQEIEPDGSKFFSCNFSGSELNGLRAIRIR
jgi:uncharacterized protein YjbI with pentapeptide repeats